MFIGLDKDFDHKKPISKWLMYVDQKKKWLMYYLKVLLQYRLLNMFLRHARLLKRQSKNLKKKPILFK